MAHHKFKVGQRVKFFRTHDKHTPLTGEIVAIKKGSNLVEVKTDAANGGISRVEAADASDVQILDPVNPVPVRDETPVEEETREAAEEAEEDQEDKQ